MVAKLCSRSQGQPEPGVRSAAMMASRSLMSREGFMTACYQTDRDRATGGAGRAQKSDFRGGLTYAWRMIFSENRYPLLARAARRDHALSQQFDQRAHVRLLLQAGDPVDGAVGAVGP